MANAREVKGRIRSVKNISQITRALEAVSASRVRRAQDRVQASRAYSEKAWEILLNVQNASGGTVPHPLLVEREAINKILIVLITSDRGLAGAYNSNIIRVAQRFTERMNKPVEWITVGRKGRDTLIRAGEPVIAEFSDMPAEPSIADVSPITQLAVEAYLSGEVDEVVIAYTDFINILAQSPVVLGWLPLTTHSEAEQVASEYIKDVPNVSEAAQDYEYEPNASAVLDEIVPRFVELQLYQALLEAQASEHAARMTAMRNATDNASDLVDDLTLEYNKARQTAITNEILDIVGGANALSESNESKAAAKAEMNGNGSKPKRHRPSKPNEPVMLTEAEQVVVEKEPESEPEAEVIEVTPEPAPQPETDVPSEPDDLTRLEGIGPKMSQALVSAGLDTYAKVAAASEEDFRKAIEEAGMRVAPSIASWAKQARFAQDGDWDGLAAYQDTLVAGRPVDDDHN